MRIENGKWVNDHGDQLSVLEAKEIVSLGQRVSSVFGQDVTHERIEIINALSCVLFDQISYEKHVCTI